MASAVHFWQRFEGNRPPAELTLENHDESVL